MILDPSVLIVEDERIVQLHLRTVLEELGYTVSGVAATADEAIRSAEENEPDLVLMDIRLPGERDGIDAARELQRRHPLRVVFLTAYADEETVQRSQEVDADGYIVKPFSKPQLRAALSTAMTRRRQTQRREPDKASLESILGGIGDGILLAGTDGALTFLNARAEALTGIRTSEAIGQGLADVLVLEGPQGRVDLAGWTEGPLAGGEAITHRGLSLVARDGTRRAVTVTISPLRDGDRKAGGVVVSLRESRAQESPVRPFRTRPIARPRMRARSRSHARPARDRPPARDRSRTHEEVEASFAAQPPPPREAPRRFGAGTRMVLYSHDTFGLGHLRRSLNIASGLVARTPGLSILLLTGSPLAHRFTLPQGVDYVKLPAVRKVGAEQYEARSLGLSDENVLKLRTNLVLRSIQDFAPDVVLVDHAPRGMRGEMLPSLAWLREHRPGCVRMLGLRDIIDDPEAVIELWKRKDIYELLRDTYDRVLVYGSPEIFDFAGAYRLPPEVRTKTRYCGYIREIAGDGEEEEGTNRWTEDRSGAAGEAARPRVVVTIGGGDGAAEEVLGSYLRMVKRFAGRIRFDSLILTGPLLPAGDVERYREVAKGLPVELRRFVASTTPYLRASDLVVSTAGYNTITQVLSHARRALVIPRVMHRHEQLLRARRLAELGLVTTLHPDEVTTERLHENVTSLLASPREPLVEARRREAIPFDGVERIAAVCAALFPAGGEG